MPTPSPVADRNLIFGLLALQMDFVTREQILDALHAWMLRKTTPIGEILREAGLLNDRRLALLQGMVEEHLAQHGGNAQASLVALSVVKAPMRQDLARIDDPDVQASLTGLPPLPGETPATADGKSQDSLAGLPTTDPVAGVDSARRFRRLREHARGGLGEVFVALDEELDREVALKEIQARHADHAESRARFLTEARVTGGLEHPGIVPVYGLGCYPDGRPYYAMRFIKGDSLQEAIATFHAPDRQGVSASERALQLRQLLGRFVDVCNAIDYAHSRGVIHRDLKPGNVMLGKYGETLVVDWGLAKVVGRADNETTESVVLSTGDSALTQAGQALGTPAYMSPEQAAGRLDRLGPASDTYSLGATLYCLLTGQAPFVREDVGVVLAKVPKGDFKRPRQVNAGVPPALEAVCLKAMALKPEDRYGSPRELAGEIERFLADEPVSAYREPFKVRVGRWARRHPAVVAGSTALVFTMLLAVTIGGLLLGQEQTKTLKEQQAKLEQQHKAREAQVGTLLDVAPQAVPAILGALEPHRDEIRPLLQEAVSKPEPKEATTEAIRLWRQHRARAALGLLAEDSGQAALLTARLFEEGLDPGEMILVRDALKPHAAELKADLWRRVHEDNPASQFRALVALAAFDPDSPRWPAAARSALVEMLKADPLHLGQWVEALRRVKQHLLPPLERVFRGEDEPLKEYRQVAASVLADYAGDRVEALADLLLAADARQYAVIKPVLMKHRQEAIARMRKELAARPAYWKDPPLDPRWQAPPGELVREIEQAGGIVAERFALCQALPLERVLAVTDGLRQSGYRPVRVRPWRQVTNLPAQEADRVALVWTRDAIDWTLQTDLTAAQVQDAPAGLIPADIAGYHTKSGDRYAVVWRKPGKGEHAVVYTSVPQAKHKTAIDVFKDDGYLPATVQALLGADGTARYSGVWWKGAEKVEKWHLRWSYAESAHDDAVFAGEHLLLDVHLGPAVPAPNQFAWVAGLAAAPRSLAALGLSRRYREIASFAAAPRHYTSVWRDNTAREAKGLHGLSAEAHLARCRELIAQGYRPVALSLVALPGEKTPLAASAWHRPVPPAHQRDSLARRQATAAATLVHLKEPEPVWPLLRHSPDPTLRSYLVERLGSRSVDAGQLVERLNFEKDVSARRALILALGESTGKDLPAAVRGPLVKKLLDWYREDPDAGIHGAIDWLLRHGKEGPANRPLDWGCAKELERIDGEIARASRVALAPGGRRWFVNGQGQTFTLIHGPVEFRMGSPLWEPDRVGGNEKPHRRVIPRSYAIMTRPVTVAQWQRFMKDRPNVPRAFLKRYSPEPGGPIIAVSWFAAAQYCNWLSEKEGVPREQWCYPETIEGGMKPYPDHLRRTGYRLLTEAEWEYACRAETTSSRSYGSTAALLGRYAWYQANSSERTWPVGQKRPNDLGLFDMHGNVWTWCQGAAAHYPSGRADDSEDIRHIEDKMSGLIRGGSFDIKTPNMRSAYRGGIGLASRLNGNGLRACRTYH
jgi:formylglycine-generating enzyme required for sulfatase activity/tRNA A-37 threonylcarbamoyl transferase component Bud32